MSLNRAALSVASIFLSLSAAFAQQPTTTTAVSPLFQGIVGDAKGKIVGRLFINGDGFNSAVRQINGTWVLVPFDAVAGFVPVDPGNVVYWFQSFDCTGQGYFRLNRNQGPAALPALGTVATISPSTQPSIYFAGLPAGLLDIGSYRPTGGMCSSFRPDPEPFYVGPAQSVPVSSLGLTPPFSVK